MMFGVIVCFDVSILTMETGSNNFRVTEEKWDQFWT